MGTRCGAPMAQLLKHWYSCQNFFPLVMHVIIITHYQLIVYYIQWQNHSLYVGKINVSLLCMRYMSANIQFNLEIYTFTFFSHEHERISDFLQFSVESILPQNSHYFLCLVVNSLCPHQWTAAYTEGCDLVAYKFKVGINI